MSSEDEEEKRTAGTKPALLGFAGLLAASLCCLPLIGIALGTIGGLGLIIGLATYRVPLTILGVAVFLVGGYQYYRQKKRQECRT